MVSTILMVAVVVILAAIVASMVFGIGLPEEPKTVMVTATRSGGENVTFMVHGGMNMDRVTEIRCWIGGGVGGEGGNVNFKLDVRAGATNTSSIPDATRVVIVGTSGDNKSWILLDKTL
ncbi:type IV pilin N-terminal domain-containing protein [Methanoculleus chikugoensis]|uniref:type IV pilin N-terminal domain-containing protein n=1 Tax=Methanoculleus chikugoensis TaxID=118126 RepID=UPI001FB45F97|nr:type IV pilin N-terminal domain-containing protein [Methanoculleus chikugoensis]